MLASLVVDRTSDVSGSTTIFFYCKHSDPEKNTFLAMARALLHQLSLHDEILLMYLFEIATTRGEPVLRTIKLAKEILRACVKAKERVYVIIDGIDECQKTELDHIAGFWLSYLGDNSHFCRCALFSQDDECTRPLLSGLPAIQVDVRYNSSDIQSFCSREARVIQEKFSLSPRETEMIAVETWSRANGMFLFARLVLDNLSDQVSKADLDSEMEPGTFPEGLNQA